MQLIESHLISPRRSGIRGVPNRSLHFHGVQNLCVDGGRLSATPEIELLSQNVSFTEGNPEYVLGKFYQRNVKNLAVVNNTHR